MKRYLAFLRAVNVSGKNKVPMPELKKLFDELGFDDAKTYLNSGNVAFSADGTDVEELADRLEAAIRGRFSLDVPVFVIAQDELGDILRHAPDWWGSGEKEVYDNLIFIMPPASFSDVYREIGEPKDGLEQIEPYKNAIFWSFNRKEYQKTNWWPKTANTDIHTKLTIRTANTVRKAAQL